MALVIEQQSEGSASVLAANLCAERVAVFDSQAGSALLAAGLDGSDSLAPRAKVEAYAAARQKGVDVSALLLLKADQLRLEPLRKNIKSIASGLRMWHFFAVSVLGYSAGATLPPADPVHMVLFVTMFRHGGTAANYVNHVLAGCRALNFSVAWHTSIVAEAKVNARMLTARSCPVSRSETQLFTEKIIKALIAYFDARAQCWRSTLILVWWKFLLRVHSEVLSLVKGDESCEFLLPSSWFGAV